MGTDRILVGPPPFRQNLCFLQGIEQLPVQKLIPHFAIERFHIAVFPGRAGFNGERLDVEVFEPPAQRLRDELRPVLRPDVLRHAMVQKQLCPRPGSRPGTGFVGPPRRPDIPACTHPAHSGCETAGHHGCAPPQSHTTRRDCGASVVGAHRSRRPARGAPASAASPAPSSPLAAKSYTPDPSPRPSPPVVTTT